jgi:hypothetical protein
VDLVLTESSYDTMVLLQQLGQAEFSLPGVAFGGTGFTNDAAQVVLVDLDRDGDIDVVSAHPSLSKVVVFFNAR